MSIKPFRFGMINEHMHTRAAWVAQAQRAEASGYATFLIRDHFAPDYFGDQFGPIAALMTAANATQTLRIGTLVFDNDYRHPVMLAKEAATLDLLSDGRFELGIGAGWLRSEYDQAGLPFERAGRRIERLEESLKVIKGLFADEPLDFAGQHYAISALAGFPKPAQRPRPPILIGGGQRRMLTLAGREADIVGLLTSSVADGTLQSDPQECLAASVAQKIAWVREGAGERFAQIELSLVPTVIITDTRRTDTEALLQRRGWATVSVEDAWQMPSLFIGSETQIIQDMHARRSQYGFSYYVFDDAMMDMCAGIVARLNGQ